MAERKPVISGAGDEKRLLYRRPMALPDADGETKMKPTPASGRGLAF